MPPKRQQQQPQMHLHNQRLATFEPILKPKSKARQGWPLSASIYQHLTPENMASAGFYYSPSKDSENDDTCACFICGVRLGGWSEEDDPWSEHYSRGSCAWAETACAIEAQRRSAGRVGKDMSLKFDTIEDLPSSGPSTQIRKNTFYSKEQKECWWPHNEEPDFKPTPQNLARAGFVYAPAEEGDDTVKCPYCGYMVEGWEAEDDPLELHLKKRPDCIFFTAQAEFPASQRSQKPDSSSQASKSRRATKVSSSKRGRTGTTATEEALISTQKPPAETVIEVEESESQSQLPPASQKSRSKRATKPRGTAATSKSRGRSKKAAEDVEKEEAGDDEAEVEETIEEKEEMPEKSKKGRRTTKSKSRSTKARSKKDVQTEEEELVIVVESDSETHTLETQPLPPKPVSKSTSKSSSKTSSSTTTTTSKQKKPLPPIPPPSPKSLPERPRSAASSQPKTSSKSQTQSQPTRLPSTQTNRQPLKETQSLSEPTRPLSQLDRFANLPSSPVLSLPESSKTTSSTTTDENPSAKGVLNDDRPIKPLSKPKSSSRSHSDSQSSSKDRQQPQSESHSDIPSSKSRSNQIQQKNLTSVLESVAEIISPQLSLPNLPIEQDTHQSENPSRANKVASSLGTLDMNMTLEQFVRLEIALRKDEMQRLGEEEIRKWEKRCKEARLRIEGISVK